MQRKERTEVKKKTHKAVEKSKKVRQNDTQVDKRKNRRNFKIMKDGAKIKKGKEKKERK